MNILDVLGVATDPTAAKLIYDAVRNDFRLNERNFREIRKTLFGTTPDLFMDYVIGTLRDNDMLPEWADEMLPRTYFDFIHQSTPKLHFVPIPCKCYHKTYSPFVLSN